MRTDAEKAGPVAWRWHAYTAEQLARFGTLLPRDWIVSTNEPDNVARRDEARGLITIEPLYAASAIAEERARTECQRAAKVAIHDDWSDAVLANMRLRASHVAICKALEAALARVSYVPGEHPVVPVKHARFVEDVAAVLSAALMPPSPMPNDTAARNAVTE